MRTREHKGDLASTRGAFPAPPSPRRSRPPSPLNLSALWPHIFSATALGPQSLSAQKFEHLKPNLPNAQNPKSAHQIITTLATSRPGIRLHNALFPPQAPATKGRGKWSTGSYGDPPSIDSTEKNTCHPLAPSPHRGPRNHQSPETLNPRLNQQHAVRLSRVGSKPWTPHPLNPRSRITTGYTPDAGAEQQASRAGSRVVKPKNPNPDP
jgi:hypothetical protein